jgi:hypothetical protein
MCDIRTSAIFVNKLAGFINKKDVEGKAAFPVTSQIWLDLEVGAHIV